MVRRRPRAGDDHGRQRRGVAFDETDGGDPQSGEDEPHGHKPEAGATIAVGSEQRLKDGRRDLGGEGEDACRRKAVVPLDKKEREQSEQR